MAKPADLTTVLSTRGRIILPKSIRQRQGWAAGVRLTVEDTPEGVLLKPASHFAQTRPEDVFASLGYSDAPKTIEEMDAAVADKARRRHAGD